MWSARELGLPLSTPVCGFDGICSKSFLQQNFKAILIGSSIGFFVILFGSVAIAYSLWFALFFSHFQFMSKLTFFDRTELCFIYVKDEDHTGNQLVFSNFTNKFPECKKGYHLEWYEWVELSLPPEQQEIFQDSQERKRSPEGYVENRGAKFDKSQASKFLAHLNLHNLKSSLKWRLLPLPDIIPGSIVLTSACQLSHLTVQ